MSELDLMRADQAARSTRRARRVLLGKTARRLAARGDLRAMQDLLARRVFRSRRPAVLALDPSALLRVPVLGRGTVRGWLFALDPVDAARPAPPPPRLVLMNAVLTAAPPAGRACSTHPA